MSRARTLIPARLQALSEKSGAAASLLARDGDDFICIVTTLQDDAGRSLLGRRALDEALRVFARIGKGRYDNSLDLARQDEIGRLLRGLDGMQSRLAERTEADARVAAEAMRIKRALDKTSTNMMIADNEGTIIYIVASGLADVGRVREAIAKGDLTRQIEAEYEGTFGQLKEATNLMVGRLKGVVERIRLAVVKDPATLGGSPVSGIGRLAASGRHSDGLRGRAAMNASSAAARRRERDLRRTLGGA